MNFPTDAAWICSADTGMTIKGSFAPVNHCISYLLFLQSLPSIIVFSSEIFI